MGKGRFKLRLSKKSNRELNPVERYRRKLKENQKLRRLVSRLSQRDASPVHRVRRHSEDDVSQDPMLGELLTTTRLRRDEEESPPSPEEPQPQEAPKPPPAERLIPTTVLVPRPLPQHREAPSDDDSDDLDSLRVASYESAVPVPAPPPRQAPQQPEFRRMLDDDKDLSDFYAHISGLL